TPHPGELARLLDRDVDDFIADPLATVEEAATRWNQTVVFKYGYTAASNGERTIVAEDAPVSLATAGSGDVLSGVIGAFAAQGLEPIDAAGLALHVGPRAARRGEQRYGSYGLIAADLPECVALELATLTDE
ncbi:MAG: bifunctional ADP-dependent NAD(P)H-hydrate dehydratase/NAD(P)H-hydrate epimerase, partial [Chloroflexota bacterium]|nr:bifunctional ADP-dependent NAD(P)H-hydrate dehydratase/NAD(P)H-hydrate epimerase [Chloroflexota bacterium]